MSQQREMKYQIYSSGPTPTYLEAMDFLESQIQEALDKGGQLVGGVSVTHCPAADAKRGEYAAYQAVLMPAS